MKDVINRGQHVCTGWDVYFEEEAETGSESTQLCQLLKHHGEAECIHVTPTEGMKYINQSFCTRFYVWSIKIVLMDVYKYISK